MKVLVGTQHPGFAGGVLTMLRAYLQWCQRDLDATPSLAFRPYPRSLSQFVQDIFTAPSLVTGEWEGLRTYSIGERFSRLQTLHYWGSQSLWNQAIAPHDILQVVCGSAMAGLPYARSGRPFVMWVATSLEGDIRPTLEKGSLARRLVVATQKRRLEETERLILQKAAWVFALSPHTEGELIERGADPRKLSLLRSPIALCPPRKSKSPSDDVTILWAARHPDPRKNTRLLIDAFARVVQKVPRAKLVLVGEWDPTLVSSLTAEQRTRVEIAGVKAWAEMPAYLNRADIFAMPSEQEGLGIAALEAMGYGVPVVSTRCGGPESFVIPERTGQLVGKGNVEEMTEALLHLIQNPDVRQRLGEGAYRLVEEQYGLSAFSSTLTHAYSQVWPEIFRRRASG